jgi:hypothetical protein
MVNEYGELKGIKYGKLKGNWPNWKTPMMQGVQVEGRGGDKWEEI